jgi:signal transduction histidine kinase
MIRASGERLLEIVNDVLAAARIESTGFETKLSRFLLALLMREGVAFMETAVSEKRRHIDSRVREDPTAYGDRKLLRQASIHVSSHAPKFGPHDRAIEIHSLAPSRRRRARSN